MKEDDKKREFVRCRFVARDFKPRHEGLLTTPTPQYFHLKRESFDRVCSQGSQIVEDRRQSDRKLIFVDAAKMLDATRKNVWTWQKNFNTEDARDDTDAGTAVNGDD